MSDRALWPANVAAGAAVLGGILVIAFPRHLLTVVQLVLVAAAVSAALYALSVHVPRTGWISPFIWLSPFSREAHRARLGHRSRVLEFLRARLSDRRQPVENAPPMPPAILRRLKPLIAAALELDSRDRRRLATARGRVSPLAYAVLTSDPLERPSWLRTVRPDARAVADAVHRILDEVDHLTYGSIRPDSPSTTAADSSTQRANQGAT